MTNNNTILNLFDDWNKALQTGNPDEVVKLYDKNAILLPLYLLKSDIHMRK